MDSLFLSEHRCSCGKLLLKGIFIDGTLEIKCKNCKKLNKIGHIKLEKDGMHYLLIVNDKGMISNVSYSACKILGYDCAELIGQKFTKVNPTMPEEIGKKFFGNETVLNEDNYFQLDTTHRTKDGRMLPVTISMKLYKPDDKHRYMLILVKVKNKKEENKLFNETNELKFIDNACDFYFEVDKNGSGVYVAPSMKKIFGIAQEDIIGKKFFDFLPADQREDAKKCFEHFSAKEQPYKRLNRAGIPINNKVIRYDIFFTPNFNDSGKFIGYSALGWLLKD